MKEKEIDYLAKYIAERITPFGGMFYAIENMDEHGAQYVYDRIYELGYYPNESECYTIMGKIQSIFNTW